MNLEKLLIKNKVLEWPTKDLPGLNKYLMKLKQETTLDTERMVRDHSEIKGLVDETMGEVSPHLNEITNFKILDPKSFYKLRDSTRMDTDSAFLLYGSGYQLVYGKWYNVFVKETHLILACFYTFHEIGHIIHLTCKKSFKKKDIKEIFADAYAFFGLETLSILYDMKYDTEYIKGYLKTYSKDNVDSILKSLADQFPTMQSMCNFLMNSTEEEIYKKSGILKKPSMWERIKNF